MPAGLQLLVNVDEESLGAMVGVDVEMSSEPSDPPGLSKFYDRNCDVNVDPNGVTWLERMCTVVRLVLNALALGQNVLVHCRQGKHRSGVLAMLLLGIMAPPG
jgi:hypothetical protein